MPFWASTDTKEIMVAVIQTRGTSLKERLYIIPYIYLSNALHKETKQKIMVDYQHSLTRFIIVIMVSLTV